MNTFLRTDEFDAWLSALKDKIGRARIAQRIRSAETGIFGKLRHTPGTRHVTDGGEKYVRVRVLQCSCQVLRDGFLIIQVVGSIKSGKLDHDLLLVESPRHLNGAFDVALL
jgi:hypothetical protein